MRQQRDVPIFWGGPKGFFSAEEVDAFRSEGYVKARPESTLAIQHQVTALQHSIELGECTAAGEGNVWDIEGKAVRSSYGVHDYIEPVKQIVRSEPLTSGAEHILGSKVYIHQTQLNHKAAFLGEKFFWHQDYTYWRNMDGMPDLRAVGVMVFVSEVTVLNAPILVIPGSHRHIYEKKMNSSLGPNYSSNIMDADQWYEERGLATPDEVRELIQETNPVPLLGESGTVIFFDPNIVHASSDNISPYDRQILLVYYNSVANMLVKPTRPVVVASRDFSAV